jgi:hypothetical protein
MRAFVTAVSGGFFMALAPLAFAQDVQPAPVAPVQTAPVQTAPDTSSTTTVVTDPGAPAAAESGQPAVRTVVVHEKDHDTLNDIQTGGLGLEWVYLNADVGVAYTDLVSLKASNWAIQDNSAAGPAFGLGAGVRLLFLSLGVRARDLQLSEFNIWEMDLEAALHFKIWRVDIALGARGGYAFLGSFSADSVETSTGSTPSNVTVHGWNVGPTLGVDVYLSKLISVGVDGNAEFLFLERPPIPLQPGQSVPNGFQGLYADSGSSVGAGFVGMAHLGVHF